MQLVRVLPRGVQQGQEVHVGTDLEGHDGDLRDPKGDVLIGRVDVSRVADGRELVVQGEGEVEGAFQEGAIYLVVGGHRPVGGPR